MKLQIGKYELAVATSNFYIENERERHMYVYELYSPRFHTFKVLIETFCDNNPANFMPYNHDRVRYIGRIPKTKEQPLAS